MKAYRRIYLPMALPGCPADLELYGFYREIDGEPERTYCCSGSPNVWVEGVGWDTADEDAACEPCEGGYFPLSTVLRARKGLEIEAETEGEAREEAQANW